MKTSPLLRASLALVLLSTLHASRCTSLAQGSLTPPGAPAAMMKSLDQIEPRTPISSVPYTISAPGSYYLTTNLTVNSGDAITIAANGVNLDLNGFTISTKAASVSGTAILLSSARTNITICNGLISSGVTNNGGVYSGPGFGNGIMPDFRSFNVRVKNVSVLGVQGAGIWLGFSNSTEVVSCTVQGTGSAGIVAGTVSDSVAYNCGDVCISATTAQNCAGYGNTNTVADGIDAVTALNCSGTSGSGAGISANMAQNCSGASISGDGLGATTAQNCSGSSNGNGRGVFATTAQNCTGTSAGGYGIYASTAQSCSGSSSSNYGLCVAYTAHNCYGGSSSGYGLYAHNAENCYGFSNTGSYGLYAITAQNCQGSAGSGTGLYVNGTAQNCYGSSTSGIGVIATVASTCIGNRTGGTALQATIGIGCSATSGTLNITYKYNMP